MLTSFFIVRPEVREYCSGLRSQTYKKMNKVRQINNSYSLKLPHSLIVDVPGAKIFLKSASHVILSFILKLSVFNVCSFDWEWIFSFYAFRTSGHLVGAHPFKRFYRYLMIWRSFKDIFIKHYSPKIRSCLGRQNKRIIFKYNVLNKVRLWIVRKGREG